MTNNSAKKERAIIVDIDGTIADHEGLRGHYEYQKVYLDRPKFEIMDLIDLVRLSPGGFKQTLFCSGREESCRETTKQWLIDKWFYRYGREILWSPSFINELDNYLFMRKTGDRRPDDIIKAEIYETHIKPKYDVLYVFDDRNRVVDMWRKKGLTCLQVADGNF
ncbi:hypothetical protein UFOVP434_103 [uncultured Caudovirales phage]|uniref:Polynucleotide kinase PNKP phosphatase domain-containing protein n=1 Tax=uncultured Caudovirales phage TaxID=2100421 RepID=A0A6J5MAS7_9CAUD|nr:hypothetical protein UFOVP434_103 [uncultured Caudovirales phage]